MTDAAAAFALPAATAAVIEGIASTGFAIAHAFLPPPEIAALRARAERLDAAGHFAPARIGRGEARTLRTAARGDRIAWLDAAPAGPAEQPLFDALEALRLDANRELTLGLFDHELHYAIYPAGAGYARHVDRFRDDDARVLSFVLYLNDGWRRDDGGALALDTPQHGTIDVQPTGGTLVAFLADGVPHAVRPARRARYSVTGWFRRRA